MHRTAAPAANRVVSAPTTDATASLNAAAAAAEAAHLSPRGIRGSAPSRIHPPSNHTTTLRSIAAANAAQRPSQTRRAATTTARRRAVVAAGAKPVGTGKATGNEEGDGGVGGGGDNDSVHPALTSRLRKRLRVSGTVGEGGRSDCDVRRTSRRGNPRSGDQSGAGHVMASRATAVAGKAGARGGSATGAGASRRLPARGKARGEFFFTWYLLQVALFWW